MSSLSMLAAHSLFPRWASLYLFYKNAIPNHFGKSAFLRFLHRVGLRQKKHFVWKMKNGLLMAISPMEGHAPWSVGWTCFEHGVWEPHIEQTIKKLLRPGDTALDIGANIGYFSAVMARCVGTGGKVFSFEPIPSSFERLSLCRELNHLDNLTVFPNALGAEEGEVEIRYNPIIMGSASIYQENSSSEIRSATVPIKRLDSLIEGGSVARPGFIKIDVEGHELAVFRGAAETIRGGKPTIVFEYNMETCGKAGWNLKDLTGLLDSYAPYRFYSLEEESWLTEIDPQTFALEEGKYVDILADGGNTDLSKLGRPGAAG